MKSDNEIIADFMGEVLTEEDLSHNFTLDQLPYRTNWNWLMPTWYKFRDLDFELNDVEIRIQHAHHMQAIAFSIAHEDISKAYSKILNGIKWATNNEEKK